MRLDVGFNKFQNAFISSKVFSTINSLILGLLNAMDALTSGKDAVLSTKLTGLLPDIMT